jgi:hypothetical protein
VYAAHTHDVTCSANRSDSLHSHIKIPIVPVLPAGRSASIHPRPSTCPQTASIPPCAQYRPVAVCRSSKAPHRTAGSVRRQPLTFGLASCVCTVDIGRCENENAQNYNLCGGGGLGRSNNEEYGLRVFEKWVLGENMCT